MALRTGAVRVHHAAHRGKITALELRDCGADFRDSAGNFVSRYAGVDSGHHAAPLVADLVQIGVADTAKQNFDLYVVFRRIAPRNCGRCKR